MPQSKSHHLSWARLDPSRQDRVRMLLLDALALAAAGTASEDSQRVLAALRSLSAGDVVVPWTDVSLAAPQAASALSNLIHAWDYDDTHDEAVVHTATIVVPAALATAAVTPVSGQQLLTAVSCGVQVLSRLARMVGPRQGVIRTAGLGAVAAAVTASSAMGMDDRGLEAAASLALAASLGPASRQAVVDGSVAKRIQPGLAAAAGLTAAFLARQGLAGPAGWLDGPYGLVPGGGLAWRDVLSSPHEIDGVVLKPYPACRYGHAAIDAAEQLHAEHRELHDDEKVVVHLPAGPAYELVSRPYRPRGEPLVDAQFSVPWQLGAIWVAGRFDLNTLRDHLHDPRVGALAERVEVRQDLPAESAMAGARVEIVSGGRALSIRAADMPGTDLEDQRRRLEVKVRSCLTVAGIEDPDATAAELGRVVRDLPDMDAPTAVTAIRAATAMPVEASRPAGSLTAEPTRGA